MLKFFLKLLGFGGVDRNAQVNAKKRVDPTMGVGPLPDEAGKMKVIGDNLWRKDPGGTWVIIAAWPHKVRRHEDLPSIAPPGATFDIGDDSWIFIEGNWVKMGSLDRNGQFISRLRKHQPMMTRPTPRSPVRRPVDWMSPSRQREEDNMLGALAAMAVLSDNSDRHHHRSNHDDTGRYHVPTCHPSSHTDHGSYDSSPSDSSPSSND